MAPWESLTEKGVYLDKVVANYKSEADECLKGEFEQWLQGQHEANDSSKQQLYENAEGKPVRRWVFRSTEATDDLGGSKVGQARAGWKHTPWGRASLVHLPGVRDYLREQKQSAHDKDTQMQMLAEFGPQNVEQAFQYFKHWVKGRPLSDAVALPSRFPTNEVVARSEFGMQAPNRMYAYDSEPNDRQPGVRASDLDASSAAIAQPGKQPVTTTTETEDRNVEDARELRMRMEDLQRTMGFGVDQQRDTPAAEFRARDDAAEAREQRVSDAISANEKYVHDTQRLRQAELASSTTHLLPALK